jgi:hypothetical protein
VGRDLKFSDLLAFFVKDRDHVQAGATDQPYGKKLQGLESQLKPASSFPGIEGDQVTGIRPPSEGHPAVPNDFTLHVMISFLTSNGGGVVVIK